MKYEMMNDEGEGMELRFSCVNIIQACLFISLRILGVILSEGNSGSAWRIYAGS